MMLKLSNCHCHQTYGYHGSDLNIDLYVCIVRMAILSIEAKLIDLLIICALGPFFPLLMALFHRFVKVHEIEKFM